MRSLLALLIYLISATVSMGQSNQITFRVVDHDTGEQLPGATAFIPDLDRGRAAGPDGLITIENLPDGFYSVEIRHVGYETYLMEIQVPYPGNQPVIAEMEHEDSHLEEVTVATTRTSRSIENAPTRIEAIPLEEVEEKINMRPGDIRMLLAESTGIQVQQTSPVSGNSNFRIQGLDGRYTQLLKDGFPLYSGFSGGLSIMQIPPLDLYQVEVVKGAASTLYGGGAIAGLVNLVTKRPGQEPEISFLANASTNRNLDFSGYYSRKFEDIGMVLFSTYNSNPGYDPSDQGFSAIPQFNRFTFNPSLMFDFTEDTQLSTSARFNTEGRLGGDMLYLDQTDRSGRYFEQHHSRRLTTQFELNHRFSDNTRFNIKNSFTFFDRSIEIPDYLFDGSQAASFNEVAVIHDASSGSWVGGLNIRTDRFRDQTPDEEEVRNFNSDIYGVFFQHTYQWSDPLSTEAGLRADLSDPAPETKLNGLFLLPRLSILYRFNSNWSARIGGGMGYKLPDMFTDEAENRAFRNVEPPAFSDLKPEQSAGINADLNFGTILFDKIAFRINQLFFITRLDDPLVLESEQENYRFRNLDGFIRSRGAESNITFIYDDLKLLFGYTYIDAQQHIDNTREQVPLNSPHLINAILMMEEHDSYRLGLESYYYSPQKLTDGSTGRGYTIFGIMGEKSWGILTLFANFENIFDTRQTRFGPIYTGSREQPEFIDIFAPLEGRYINAGIKIDL